MLSLLLLGFLLSLVSLLAFLLLLDEAVLEGGSVGIAVLGLNVEDGVGSEGVSEDG